MSELAVIEGEAVEPMSKADARKLNQKIQSVSQKASDNAWELLSLLEQAAAGSIHVALGYKSWTDWYAENVKIDVGDAADRKNVVAVMSGKGMSQRAIAQSLGINQATVSRDLKDVEPDADASPTTKGRDNKDYKRGASAKASAKSKADEEAEPEIIEGEVVEEPVRKRSITDEVGEVVKVLTDWSDQLDWLANDPRFAKSAKTIHKRYGGKLGGVVDNIETFLKALVDTAVE